MENKQDTSWPLFLGLHTNVYAPRRSPVEMPESPSDVVVRKINMRGFPYGVNTLLQMQLLIF